MKNRDHKTKQALIDYLSQDTDERFWQAIANFGEKHGLCEHYLCTSVDAPMPTRGYRDLFYQESDEVWIEEKMTLTNDVSESLQSLINDACVLYAFVTNGASAKNDLVIEEVDSIGESMKGDIACLMEAAIKKANKE